MLSSTSTRAFGRQSALRCSPAVSRLSITRSGQSPRSPLVVANSAQSPDSSSTSSSARRFSRRTLLVVASAAPLANLATPPTTQAKPLKMVKLYDFPLAFNPPKAKLILVEKKVQFDTEVIDILGSQGVSPYYLKINPAGTAPTLQDGEKLITESKAIIEYVDAKDGNPLGGNNVDRAAVADWLDTVDKWDGNLFAAGQGGGAAKVLGILSAYKKKYSLARMAEHPELREVYEKKLASMEKMGKQSSDPSAIESNKAQLHSLLQKAETVLSKQPYLAGNEYSAADVIITPVLFRVNMLGQAKTYLDSRPKVQEYYKRLQARPSFHTVFGPAQNPLVAAKLLLPDLVKITWSKVTGRY